MRHINILNLFILGAAIGFYLYFLNPLLTTPLSVELPSPKEISLEMQVSADKTTKSSISDYTLIGEQNLFHPDRVMPAEKLAKAEKKAAISVPRPELVLHGTMIVNGLKIAYVEDKKATPTTPGRGARQLVVKEGDNISGFILKQITENMIVLANGEEQMTLYLDELKDRKGEITGSTKALSPATTVQPYVAPRHARCPSRCKGRPRCNPFHRRPLHHRAGRCLNLLQRGRPRNSRDYRRCRLFRLRL